MSSIQGNINFESNLDTLNINNLQNINPNNNLQQINNNLFKTLKYFGMKVILQGK